MSEIIRAAEIPVARPLSMDWPALETLLHDCWEQSTYLANWCIQKIIRAEAIRTPEMKSFKEFPKYPFERGMLYALAFGREEEKLSWVKFDCPHCKKGWFPSQLAPGGKVPVHDVKRERCPGNDKKPVARQRKTLPVVVPEYPGRAFWAGAAQQACAVIESAEKRYGALRKEIVWDQTAALPVFRYPQPFPVHMDSWRPRFEDGVPIINVTFPGGRVDLVLRGGDEFRRQLAFFRKVVDGEAKKCELSIRPQRTSSSHRRVVPFRVPGGGERGFWRAMVKLVVKTAPTVREGKERPLVLSTDPNAFWVAELDGRRPWVLNADHVKRMFAWLAVHEDRLDRLSQDTKAERRLNPDWLRGLNESRERCCLKHSRRVSSWLHETTAHLAGYCVRQHVTHVLYRDVDQGFIERFPWYRLREMLRDKLKAVGIVLDCTSDGGEKTHAG